MLNTENPIKSTLERVVIETTVQHEQLCGEPLLGLSSDLSVGGMYLKTKYILDSDETITLSFSIPFNERVIAITCKARVAWTNYEHDKLKLDYPPGVGLEFLDLLNKDFSTLSKFIDSYDEHKKMNMICSWCGKHLGMRKGPYGKTSHGICGQCKEKHF
jgi:hypothetical protein